MMNKRLLSAYLEDATFARLFNGLRNAITARSDDRFLFCDIRELLLDAVQAMRTDSVLFDADESDDESLTTMAFTLASVATLILNIADD